MTVKHGGYFSEVEHILSFVFCRRGVQFASGEPLADLAAGAVDVHFGEVACDFDWFSGVFELPEFVVAFGFDGLDPPCHLQSGHVHVSACGVLVAWWPHFGQVPMMTIASSGVKAVSLRRLMCSRAA